MTEYTTIKHPRIPTPAEAVIMEDFLIDLVNLHLAYVKDTHEDVEGALVIHVRDFLAVHGLWEALPE